MASHNAARYIRDAIQSVLAQTLPDWELIIADDASTDNSVEVIETFTSDKRIRLVKREENGGYGDALRTAIAHATRPIIGILDADDALRNDALRVMVNAHAERKYGLIYSQYDVCDVHLCRRGKGFSGPLPEGRTYLDVLIKGRKPNIVGHFKTFKRTAYDQTPGFTSRRRTVDKDLVLKLEEVTSMKFVDIPLYLYRVNPEGISQNPTTRWYRKEVVDEAMARRGLLP